MMPTYMGSGDPARRRNDYYPWWLDNLADDVTLEASAMDGAAQGAEAVRSIVVAVKTLYEYQEISYAGPYGDGGFIEEYTTQIHGEPLGVAGLVTRNAAGQAQHIVVNHRPRSSLLFLSRLMGEKLAGTPYAKYFLASELRPRRLDGVLGYEHRVVRQDREPVVHSLSVGGIAPVAKEPRRVGQGQPAFDLMDFDGEGHCPRRRCFHCRRHDGGQAGRPVHGAQ